MAVFSNISSCEESNPVARFNPAPTFANDPAPTFANNNHPSDSAKRVSETGCYWPDGTPADGIVASGDSSSLGPFYPCLDSGKTYSPNDSVVCCSSGDICFGEANLCGVADTDTGGEGNTAVAVMYRGGCTAQPDAWEKAPGCPQKCLDHARPFANAVNGVVMVMSCDNSDRADNLTLFCSNDALDPTKCDHDGASLDGYDIAEAWGMMASETLEIHGTALSTVTSIPLAKTSSTLSTSSASSTTSTMAMGTPPTNVTAPNSPNTTTIILAVGIPLGLLFFFGMVALTFVCYRRRHAPETEPEQKRSSFTVLSVNQPNTKPTDTNSLGTVHSERHAIPGPLSSNPILPFSPSDGDLTTLAGTSTIPQQSVHTSSPPSPSNNTIPYISHSDPPPPPEGGRPSTPTPWPASSPFIHAYANENLTSNRNSFSPLRKSQTQPSHLSPPVLGPNTRESYQSTHSTHPFPSYSEPAIGLFPPNSGPQFPFYSREVHDRLQEIEYQRGLDEYYGAREDYVGFARGGHHHHHHHHHHQRREDPNVRGGIHELEATEEGRPVSQEFEFDFEHSFGCGRPAVGVGRAQVVEIGRGRGGREQQEQRQGGGSTVTEQEIDEMGGGHGWHWSTGGAGAGAGAGRGSGSGHCYNPYRSSA